MVVTKRKRFPAEEIIGKLRLVRSDHMALELVRLIDFPAAEGPPA